MTLCPTYRRFGIVGGSDSDPHKLAVNLVSELISSFATVVALRTQMPFPVLVRGSKCFLLMLIEK